MKRGALKRDTRKGRRRRRREGLNRLLAGVLSLSLLLGDAAFAEAAESDYGMETETAVDQDASDYFRQDGGSAVTEGGSMDAGEGSSEESMVSEGGKDLADVGQWDPGTVSGGDAGSGSGAEDGDPEEGTNGEGNGAQEDPGSGLGSPEDGVPEEDEASEENDSQAAWGTVSGGDAASIRREPECYHQDAEPEDYGTLVAFDDYSRTYHVEGNQYVTVLGNDGTTYLDGDGNLQQVDNRLEENPVSIFGMLGGEGASYSNRANDYRVIFPEKPGKPGEGSGIAIISQGHALMLYPAEGFFGAGTVRDNAIRYSDVFPNIDYQYTVLGNSVKEDIVLLERTEKGSFSYLIEGDGLSASLVNNTLYLHEPDRMPEEAPVFVLEAPEMEDASGEISFGVRMELEEAGDDMYLVTVTPDRAWLDAPERVYPVRIDPTAIQVTGSAIRVACAEEGSPNTVIGDNQYPYVGYDDGITSGNLAGFGSRHLNCRTYFSIDYDFLSLAAEAEIVSASLQVYQKTRWSRGSSQFGLYGVEEPWQANRLSWNSQLGYNHYFLDSQPAAADRGQALTFNVTEEVSAWINGTSENHGLVLKAQVEAPGEAEAAAGVKMQCEVLYNNSSARYAPKLVLSWTGELTDLAGLSLDDTTIEIYPVTERSGDKSVNTLGVAAHGLARAGSTVHYSLINGATGETEAEASLVYPDSDSYRDEFPSALEYKRRLSNWQSQVFSGLVPGQVYYIEAYAEGPMTASGAGAGSAGPVVKGAAVTSDRFLIHREGALDLIPRIARHYGVEADTILADMRMQDGLTKEGSLIFIRNPQNTAPYTAGELSGYYRSMADGLLLGRAENCVFGHEPINLNTGNFYMEQTDGTNADIGGDFFLSRSYNSKGAGFQGSLGYGWSTPLDERLGELEDGSLLWLRGTGNIVTFARGAEGYIASAGCGYILAEDEGGYRIKDQDTLRTYCFNTYGLLTAIEDIRGSRTAYAYDMDQRLTAAVTPSGKTYRITLDAEDRILAVTLPDGGVVGYTYDEEGNMAAVTDPAGHSLRYEYDGSHRMTAWYDGNGIRVVENVYDEDGRVIKQTDAEGAVVTLSYEAEGQKGRTLSKDAMGNLTVYHYDSLGRTVRIEYPDGTWESRSYEEGGHLCAVTDREGVTVSYSYDAAGRLAAETREDGAVRRSSYTEGGLPETVTDFDGGVTVYGYDSCNRLVAVTDPAGGIAAYAYDDRNRLISATDPEGHVTSYAYDGEGACPISMTDGAGGLWSYAYDAMNRLLSVTDPEGAVSRREYNAKGWLIRETDGAGNAVLYAFDNAGRVIGITDKEGNASIFTYDKMNRILQGRDPLGNTLTYTYDSNGNKLTETDAEGGVTSYAYDAMNRLISAVDANGRATSYEYDAGDRVVGVTDRTGAVTSYSYDPMTGAPVSAIDACGNETLYKSDVCGRVKKIIYADQTAISYVYDMLGRPVSVTDQLGRTAYLDYDGCGSLIGIRDAGDRVWSYEYDGLNRLVKTQDPMGGVCVYGYDGAGNLVSAKDELGRTTAYAYDAMNRLTALTDALGGAMGFAYDREGRLLSDSTPEGRTTAYTYDAIGRLTQVQDALGNVTSYEYDGIGRIVSAADGDGALAAYAYDGEGNLTETRDGLGNVHAYAYDGEGRMLSHTYPNGEEETYAYLPTGELASRADRYGVKTTYTYDVCGRLTEVWDTAGNRMLYEYDHGGNLVRQTDVLGRSAVYGYDALNRVVSVTAVDGAVTLYAYDDLDRLVKVTDPAGGVTSYEYDGAGNLIGMTKPGEAAYSYAYDVLNRLRRKVDPEGAATVFAYDGDGNLTAHEDGNGISTYYGYDALNRLVSYTDGNGGVTAYNYDNRGNLISVTTPEGITESYGYDGVGNLTSVTDGMGETWRYTYDKLYRLVRQTSPLGAEETYTYDKHDVITSVTDAMGAVTLYKVNANGKVERQTMPNGGAYLYDYDGAQRLVSVTTPLGYITAFTYSDGDDIIRQEDSLGRATLFEYDVLHNLTKVTDPEGGVTTYGYDGRGNRTEAADALGNVFAFSYDRADRMTAVTDPERKSASIVYDREGNIESVTMPGNRTVRYGYDGNYNRVSVTDPKGYVYGYVYDKDDRLIGTVDPLGQRESYVYDDGNRLTAQTDKMGLTESYAYDAHGNVLSHTDAGGRVTSYAYDLKDRMTALVDPMGSAASYAWDVMDNLTAVTDYLGRGTSYDYDLEGNLTAITDAAGRKEAMEYDAASRLQAYTSNGGNRVGYDYDKLNRLVEKSYEDSAGNKSAGDVDYTYNAIGGRESMEDETGDTEYTYDALGRLSSVTVYRRPSQEGGHSHDEGRGDKIGYEYDEADELSAILYPDGTAVSYQYDLNGNLTGVTGRRGETAAYEYDALNRPVAVHLPNGIGAYSVYNGRNQVVELTNRCDDCGWVLGHYVYTYDERGFIVAEHSEEAREMDAYGRQPHAPYKPERAGENCGHGCGGGLSYYLLVMDRAFTYDDAGKLLSATETEAGCGTTSWRFAYDLMGNRTLEEKKNPGGKVVESNRYVYNESNQLSEAVLCDGRSLRKVCYSYDGDGNLTREYSPTDNGVRTYSYTVESRLRAVYEGNTLQMAAAYDGDGNRVYQLSYNPEKDEDFSAYYRSHKNADYDGTGIQLKVWGEVSATEEELMGLMGASGAVLTSRYELIEYVNDVNREHAEVLVEQNLNGRADTVYTYGMDRIGREMFGQVSRSSYYLYDPRGSVAGLTDGKGHLIGTYQYGVSGELTYGGARYENEYTYNGESYSPVIRSQYLRARYYCVTTASFLTEDAYLGSIREPLTLNRYNYCLSSYLNYRDPSGNYTAAQGRAAHEALQNKFRELYSCGMTEVRIKNYMYTVSGTGRVDMLLYTSEGIEVYELKPYWQMHIYDTDDENILKKYVKDNYDEFLPGWKQREGYMRALEKGGETISRKGTSFNPNGWKLPIKDAYYDYARYFTVAGQPGMIYYKLERSRDKKRELATVMEKVKERGRANVQNCEPIPVRQQGWFGYYGPGIYEGFDPAPDLPEKIGGRGLGGQSWERYRKYG
ncbi:MAG: DNRLRE domain-containing protein, partial [Lachnospiraceae bacterium]|nr:DNRLRE domain-containing protein [Lachnospiraceae bacterium]